MYVVGSLFCTSCTVFPCLYSHACIPMLPFGLTLLGFPGPDLPPELRRSNDRRFKSFEKRDPAILKNVSLPYKAIACLLLEGGTLGWVEYCSHLTLVSTQTRQPREILTTATQLELSSGQLVKQPYPLGSYCLALSILNASNLGLIMLRGLCSEGNFTEWHLYLYNQETWMDACVRG